MIRRIHPALIVYVVRPSFRTRGHTTPRSRRARKVHPSEAGSILRRHLFGWTVSCAFADMLAIFARPPPRSIDSPMTTE